MGIVDYENLHKIYRICVDYCKQEKIPFHFKIDSGTYETAIEFWAIGYYHPPRSKNWEELKKQGNEIKCPDILDFENKIIIELEEEPKPGKKGHTKESDTDEHRDMLYRIAGFRVLKIWETEYKNGNWKKQLFEFLIDCSKRPTLTNEYKRFAR